MDPTILSHPTPPLPNPPTPQVPPTPPPASPSKHSKWFYIGLAAIVIGGLCCILGVVALLVSLSLNRKATTAAPANLSPATSLPLQTLPPATQDIQPVSVFLLEVNGIGAAHVKDSEFNLGDSGLAVWAGSAVDGAGYYARDAFADFSVALP